MCSCSYIKIAFILAYPYIIQINSNANKEIIDE